MRILATMLVLALPALSGCATTSSAKQGAEQDMAAAQGKAAAAGETAQSEAAGVEGQAQALGEQAQDSGEGWKDKLKGQVAEQTGCSGDDVKIDDWQSVMSEDKWAAHCGERAYTCSRSGDDVSCDPSGP